MGIDNAVYFLPSYIEESPSLGRFFPKLPTITRHRAIGRSRSVGTVAAIRLSHVTDDALPELDPGQLFPVVSPVNSGTTTSPEADLSEFAATIGSVGIQLAPEPSVVFEVDGTQSAATIARWEGTVLEVMHETRELSVQLRSKSGPEPDHACEISLDEISPDDLDLVEPGAVFYIEQIRHLRRRTVSFSQSLTFRRLPVWNATILDSVDAAAERLVGRFKEPRLVE